MIESCGETYSPTPWRKTAHRRRRLTTLSMNYKELSTSQQLDI